MHTFTHMHKQTRSIRAFPIALGSIKPVPTLTPARNISQDPRGKGNRLYGQRTGRELHVLNFIQAWVFKSGPRASIAQLLDGSLLDDSFRSLAAIRDIRVVG